MADNWYQQALTPPQVIEAHMRLGFVPSQDHVQALVEISDPTTGILIATWSAPHHPMHRWLDLSALSSGKLAEMVGEALEPF